MIETKFQRIDIQDAINKLMDANDAGDLLTSCGRCLGNIESGNGRYYSLTISMTNDPESFCADMTLPVISSDEVRKGKAFVRAPEGHFHSGEMLTEQDLDFPPYDDF